MTKEDVIEILERFVLGAKPCSQKEIVDACVSAYRMLKEQPSIPSNLDEAAEKEIERFCSDMLNVDIIWARMPLTKRFGLQMAKFGAEWMAGQGETHELEVESPVLGPPMICCPVHADNGDKVVVQIRKK